MSVLKSVTALAAFGATALMATPAAAQETELDPAAVTAAVRYSLPSAFEGYMTRCFTALDADGYAISNADSLREKFSEGSEASWPGAKALIMQAAEEEMGDMTGVFSALGDDALQPLVNGLVEGMVAEELKTDDCAMIERGLEILDPMPADNVAAFVGFIVELGLSIEDEQTVRIPPPPSARDSESRQRKLREQEQERGQ